MQIGAATVENSMKGRWEGGLGWWTHAIADSCQCMAKTTAVL